MSNLLGFALVFWFGRTSHVWELARLGRRCFRHPGDHDDGERRMVDGRVHSSVSSRLIMPYLQLQGSSRTHGPLRIDLGMDYSCHSFHSGRRVVVKQIEAGRKSRAVSSV